MPAGNTQSFTVSSGAYSQVVVQSYTLKGVTVGEDVGVVGSPTTDFYVLKSGPTGTPRRIKLGSSYTFTGIFAPGTLVGFVQTVTGTTTFFQDES